MRYVEAYEIIRTALKKSDMELPLTGNFLSNFFDKHVNDIGLRVVRDKRSFDITPSGLSYMIGQNDFTDRIFKVESSSNNVKTLVPYVPDASIHSGLTTNEVDNIGYYVSHLTSKNGTLYCTRPTGVGAAGCRCPFFFMRAEAREQPAGA